MRGALELVDASKLCKFKRESESESESESERSESDSTRSEAGASAPHCANNGLKCMHIYGVRKP